MKGSALKIYLSGERASLAPSHSVYVCPARHLEGEDMPEGWVTDKNEPVDITVEFHYGIADVPSNLGAYMLKYGLASKSRLIIPNGVRAA